VSSGSLRRALTRAVLGTAVLALTPSPASADGGAQTRFYVPPPHKEAVQQALQLVRQHRVHDALRIAALESKPKAVWVTKGTPADARAAVKDTIRRARVQRAVPCSSPTTSPAATAAACRRAAR
jgi:endoglucanase